MAADERWSNLYLYGCTARAFRVIATNGISLLHLTLSAGPATDSFSAPFGCEAVTLMKSGLYLTKLCSQVLGHCATHCGQVGLPHRTLPQVFHRPEERIS